MHTGILTIRGEADPVVTKDELEVDSKTVLGGSENLAFKTVETGHEFPITMSDQVIQLIRRLW